MLLAYRYCCRRSVGTAGAVFFLRRVFCSWIFLFFLLFVIGCMGCLWVFLAGFVSLFLIFFFSVFELLVSHWVFWLNGFWLYFLSVFLALFSFLSFVLPWAFFSLSFAGCFLLFLSFL